MLWVLKRTVSKTYDKTDGFENIYKFTLKNFTLAFTSISNEAFIISYCRLESAIFVSAIYLASILSFSHSAS